MREMDGAAAFAELGGKGDCTERWDSKHGKRREDENTSR